MAGEDRRRFIRLSTRLKTACQVLGAEDQAFTLTKNVSGGGMSLFTKTKLSAGTILGLEVQFPGREGTVRFTAQVIWSGELITKAPPPGGAAYETGVRFLDIVPEDREFILRYAERPPA